ncbi:MAG: DAK2 domain-containing protein [Mollicutes bacterium]|nr:DAK2 domain-containing protein [Mollicutes bacterium]MDD7546642.1 DAK2 domain-containing protein [Bacilli bacterium]MDY3761927.1 DAK2 domain-containing protein [Candidatus Onthovivens sp.]MCI6615221.1 DAK2 domain-containing protein [Mollicutes bacterium]MCI7225146.1 DAK2 domain-containing protein [Mollicutes bacterium]
MRTIDGQMFKMMVISASNNLYNHYPEVDALNVFPVPDGDTGMNMNLTLTSGAKEVQNRSDNDIYSIAKTFSRGLLMGARGNSGVITSQIFRGFAEALEGKKEINAVELADAFVNGSKIAYKAVIRPVEGTILTVIRESSENLKKKIRTFSSIEDAFKILLHEAKESLERTPNLLPVLKEVGVVDSGGAGLVKILEGMESMIHGDFIERNEAEVVDKNGNAQVKADEEESEFGYCTEFILRLGPKETKKAFNKNRFTSVLNAHGNSLVVVQDEDLVKVHVHTLTPGNIFNYAQQFGEFVKLKCENMTEQHNEILFSENAKDMAASKLSTAPLAAPKEKKEYALIATSSGSGIDELFKEVGVEYIVSGGQTMNPSTNDFIDAVKKCNAKVCYIFPNNGNIILAASQAKEVLKDEYDIRVIPTKTIMQGVVSAMNFNPDLSNDDNESALNDAISAVKSGAVTFSIKDTEINGVSVKKDEYMAIRESKDIISSFKDKFDALRDLIKHLVDEDSALVTILYGEDVSDEDANALIDEFNNEYPDFEFDIRKGNQPVYSFIVGVE